MFKHNQTDFIDLLESSKRGKLKVYIGSIAGVGKTYRMLSEAHKLHEKGIDVVIGFIETHERPETKKLVEGIELIPRQKVEYNGVVIEEIDLDLILARKPAVVIIDELPHTNLPNARNHKRYQDVIELLLAGLNIICAFNIQHLESLNDVVYNATGIRVTETIPDNFFEYADQIVNIDISVEDLLDRLKAGNIYTQEKIDSALNNFFKPENISQLRELALREVAECVEFKKDLVLHQNDKTRSASDRLMVIYEPKNYSQKYLIRKASRLVGKLNTDWFILFVELKKNNLYLMDSQKQRHFYADIQLAQELGAQFIHLQGDNFIASCLEFALSEDVKRIMIGCENESLLKWFTGESLLKTLIRINKFDIHIAARDAIANGD